MSQYVTDEHTVLVAQPSLQCQAQQRQLRAQAAPCQLCEHLRVLLAAQEHLQHVPSAGAEHVRCDGSQLEIGGLQYCVQPIDLLGPRLYQRFAIAGEFTQVANRLRRDETGFEEAVAQQVGEPFTVFDVCFAPSLPGHGLHMLRVDEDDLVVALKQIEHRTPVDARRFHRYLLDRERG